MSIERNSLRRAPSASVPARVSARFHVTFVFATLVLIAFSNASHAFPPSTRIDLFPRVQAGQILTYEVAFRGSKATKTKSSVTLAQTPGDISTNIRMLIRIEILGVARQEKRSVIHARASF